VLVEGAPKTGACGACILKDGRGSTCSGRLTRWPKRRLDSGAGWCERPARATNKMIRAAKASPPSKGRESGESGYHQSQPLSNCSHESGESGSNKNRNGENQVEKNEQSGPDLSDIIAREQAALAATLAKKNGGGES
jgi:hypothetical protein